MTRSDIEEGLREAGLCRGDIVLLHASLSSLGHVEGGAEALVDAFLAVLGEEGTLVTPTFAGGAVPEAAAKHPRAVTSVAPTAVMSAIGAGAEAVCKDHWKAETAHAHGTPCMRVAEMGGYVCLLGVDQDRSTALHTIEELLRLPYLKTTPPREIETPEGNVMASFDFFPGPHRDFIGLDRAFRETGVMKIHRIGNAVVRLMKADALIEAGLEMGRHDAAFALCDNPNCPDCIDQRAKIRRSRLREERFRLVAAASLAGRYVPEIIENCRASGVDHIELDMLQGKPVQAVPGGDLARAMNELQAADLSVTSLRPSIASGKQIDALFAVAADAGIRRLVLPMVCIENAVIASALDRGLKLSFCNTACLSKQAGEWIKAHQPEAGRIACTFNAAHFVRAGEQPFAASYKGTCRCYVDQLDVEDCTFDGTPRPLAQGNAEIKEMISILRCSSFAGDMVLGAGNRTVGTLRETTDRFMELLGSM